MSSDMHGAGYQPLVAHFLQQADEGRGNCISGVIYIEINDAERQAFPALISYFAIAVEKLETAGKAQYWLFRNECDLDEEILAALSLPAPTCDDSRQQ